MKLRYHCGEDNSLVHRATIHLKVSWSVEVKIGLEYGLVKVMSYNNGYIIVHVHTYIGTVHDVSEYYICVCSILVYYIYDAEEDRCLHSRQLILC